VVSSEYEGDGIVVLEALQNGNPVLLRDIADLRRFDLSDDNYFKDQAHLTEKLSEFRANPTLFNVSDSERDRILRTRNIKDIQRQWAALIHDLVEGTR
jgi:glycosyltransferase involved in cell wall biosynthesis